MSIPAAKLRLLVSVWCAVSAAIAPAATVVVDAAVTHQTIRGFGGATAFQPPDLAASLTESELDTLFGNESNQIGFTILRIRVATDEAWRAIELAHAQGARERGAQVIASPWSPPAEMKTNNALIDGALKPSSYAEYAAYLNNFARYMAENGAPLYAISIQNEPDIDVDYESCDWTPAEMLDFCRNHAGAITLTRVIAPESFQFRRNISDPILNDDLARANVDIIGGHIYGGGLADYPLARSKGREVWMTEHLVLETTWADALATGKEIHDCLAVANFNAYLWWYLRRFYGPLGEDGVITKRGHVMTQFAKFIRPGALRVEATANPAPGVYVSAYQREKLVIVAVNQGGSAVNQAFSIQNVAVDTVKPWVTSSTLNVAQQPEIAVTAGAFSANLPAQSITTFVGDVIFPAPTIDTPPRSHTIETGDTVVLDVAAAGEFVSYQWNHGATPIAGATSRLLAIEHAASADAGTYTVTATNTGGSATSIAATITVTASSHPGRLANISTRSPAGAGDNVQIGGFIVSGSSTKQVLVRAAGPALNTRFGLTGVLLDPTLEIFDQASRTTIASNDDWDPALAATFDAVGAFPWTDGSKDAALVVTLDPGAYTALVRGNGGGTGVALVEAYEIASGGTDPRLLNISTRSFVDLNDSVQIGGFVIGGATARTVVIRAAGPALAQAFNLAGVLKDPVIELRDQVSGDVIAINDDWDFSLAPHFAAVGAFPWSPESRDAAIMVTLDPGLYTAIVRGKDAGTGIALVEIYDRP